MNSSTTNTNTRRRGRPPGKAVAPVRAHAREQLRALIRERHLQVGDVIPPEHELVTVLGASRLTVRAAIADLCAAYLLERRHGIGTFVRKSRQLRIGILAVASNADMMVSPSRQWWNAQLRYLIEERKAATLPLFLQNDETPGEQLLELLDDHAVDGVVFAGVEQPGWLLPRLLGAGIPVATTYRWELTDGTPAPGAGWSARRVLAQAQAWLYTQAPRRVIIHLQEPNILLGDVFTGLRRQAAANLILRTFPQGQRPLEAGRALARAWLQDAGRHPDDAILSLDHFEILGFQYACIQAGLRIEECPRLLLAELAEAPMPLPWPAWRLQVQAAPALAAQVEILFTLIQQAAVIGNYQELPMAWRILHSATGDEPWATRTCGGEPLPSLL